jgi:GTP-binding protein EngB required for normal cell division
LAEDNRDTRLVTSYESLRRREYELITTLLDILPKVENLGEERISQVRDALFHADYPFLMVFVGPFSSGKSSIINALVGKDDLLRVGPVPTTDRISILRYGDEPQYMDSGGEVDTVFHPNELLKQVSFVDTPGLESIFQKHEETTRRFLHRSDVVLLVMLATQAMTAANLNYIRMVREYGKKVIILINQSDLLTADEQAQVRDYVLEQGRDLLGAQPEVWMVSARQGIEAWVKGGDHAIGENGNQPQKPDRDIELWQESGLYRLEEYITTQITDADRLRQKLQTPLQILQNVNQVALDAVKSNQAVLDQYQSISDNVEQQLTSYKREQDKIVREMNDLIRAKFDATSDRGGEAIMDIFQLSRALPSVSRGFVELIGVARLFRRRDQPYSQTRLAFEKHKVFEPVRELPDLVSELGPRLEGKDMQDVDDLVKYAHREIGALPQEIRGKVIGKVQTPVQYDRSQLQDVRASLEEIEQEALSDETERLDQSLRNTLYALAIWEFLIIVSLIALILSGSITFDTVESIGFMVFMLALGIGGFLLMPLMGRGLKAAHASRMNKLSTKYVDTLTVAADKQVDYGMRMRREVVAPLTRLVEAQTAIQTGQLNRLQAAQQEMVNIESELAKLGKRRLIGLRN